MNEWLWLRARREGLVLGVRFAFVSGLLLLCGIGVACSGAKSPASTGRGGSAGGVGGRSEKGGGPLQGDPFDGGPFDGGALGGGGSALDAAAACQRDPAPLRRSGTLLELPFELTFAGRPFVYGEANAVGAGVSVVPLNLRFYVSQVQLLSAGGDALPVDVVTSTGALQPYGVFLFNAEDADAQTLRVLAPPGAYTRLTFALGLTVSCNRGSAAGRSFPLSADSQMTWPIPIGYLFLRYEGRVSLAGDAGEAMGVPSAIHMGADLGDLGSPGALIIRLDGALSLPTSGVGHRAIRLAMDQIFIGAAAEVDLTGFPFADAGAEVVAGERLRRSGPTLPLFVLGP